MLFYGYNCEILPDITLIGIDNFKQKHSNPNRTLDEYIFYIIKSGEIFFNEDNKEYHLKPGDCFLFEPGKHHFGTKESNYSLFYVHFKHKDISAISVDDNEWLKNAHLENKLWLTNIDIAQAPKKNILIPKTATFDNSVTLNTILNLAEKAINHSNIRRENYNVLCSCAISELFIEIYRQFVNINLGKKINTSKSGYICSNLMAFLNSNFHRKLTSNIIETELTYNFDYLNQVFKKNFNTTIFKMLEKIRIENAKKLISTYDISLAEVAERTGFDNSSYFSKTFKKHTGISPLVYRNEINKQNL